MYVNTAQIKKALIDIANENGRPHFDVSVVRDVIEAIKNNSQHHLKSTVLVKIKDDLQDSIASKNSEQTIRLKRLRAVCTTEAIKKQLGDDSGLGLKQINHMVRGRYEINNSVWLRLELLLQKFEHPKP